MPPTQVITFIIGTIIILFGAYYVTYFIGTKASGSSRASFRSNRLIHVRDRYAVSRDKGFYIIEVAGKIYIVGVANNGMTLFDTHGADEFEKLIKDNNQDAQTPWGSTPVGRYGNKLTQKVVAFVASKTGRGPKAKDENENAGNEKDGEKQKANFKDNLKEASKNADLSTDKKTGAEPEVDDGC